MLKYFRFFPHLLPLVLACSLVGSVFAQQEDSEQRAPSPNSWATAKPLKNGGFFEGPTLYNKAHGKGREKFTDGREYIGEFEGDFPDGYGTEYDSDGHILKQGFWRYGVLITSTPYGPDK